MKVSSPKPESKTIVARMVLKGEHLTVTIRGSDDAEEIADTLERASTLVFNASGEINRNEGELAV
jgi:hypothetical protein